MLATLFSMSSIGSTIACVVSFTVEGSIFGSVGELASGQVRAGHGVLSTSFTLDGDELWDDEGQGCWWTPPTYVLQCDAGQRPEKDFRVRCDGMVSFRGQTVFWECVTGEEGQYNLYLGDQGGSNCGRVRLRAGGCHSDCLASSSAAPSPSLPFVSSSSSPSTSSSSSLAASSPTSCPPTLQVPHEFPHLIISVNASRPDQASGTSFFGNVSPTVSSLFNFDITAESQGRKCSLVFLFPHQDRLETSSFTMSGDGLVDFFELSGPVSEHTTWRNRPGKKRDLGVFALTPGGAYSVATFDCPAEQRVAFGMSSAGDGWLRFFQDVNPAPIGLYITKC